jgi:hypothetical protein
MTIIKGTRNGEQGSALIYILIAIALLALLTVSFMQPSSQQTQSQNGFKLVSQLSSQIDFIRSAVQECVATYYRGDALVDTSSGGSDPNATLRYPLAPNSALFASATIGPTPGRLVKDIRCPGNPGDQPNTTPLETMSAPGNSVNHTPIFSSASGKFLPPTPDLFTDWEWYNGTDGVFFWTSSAKTDAYITTALAKLKGSFSACEADVIDATGGAVPLDSESTVSCPTGSQCFRVWMISNPSHVCP